MKIQATLMSVVVIALGLGASSASSAPTGHRSALTPIQYAPYPDQRYNPGDRRDDYAPYARPRGPYDRAAPLWRPGDVLPPQLLDIVVDDWERRGLQRPPSRHLWVRVDPQFILVRERDRMISRIVSFD